ncbi:MAG TPA: hypothetical protein ACFYEL_04230, partial [Candidatus Wunengus californicus]|uniref:hypothetical protein n=1 Tax=Candidatus Wunengus californicus TaxID=3367619 RepID=UPI004029B2AD|nr:hypothetical protein [Planctomycetota bacterium]
MKGRSSIDIYHSSYGRENRLNKMKIPIQSRYSFTAERKDEIHPFLFLEESIYDRHGSFYDYYAIIDT